MRRISNPSRLAQLVRLGKWLTLIAWIIALFVTFPFISKLNQSLDNSLELPAENQAQKVIELQERADPTSKQGDLAVAYENKAGLTPENKQTITAQRTEVLAAKLDHVKTVEDIVYSPDGQVAYFLLRAAVPSDATTEAEVTQRIVTKVRSIARPSAGLTTVTTGSMAFDADSNSADADRILLVSAAIIVTLLLILTYRSALLWLVPLLSAVLAISLTDAVVYALTKHGLSVNSLDSSITIVLVFGVATDYGMLLISRYREYLHVHADKHQAVALALRSGFEAITASAATVVLALLALTFADFGATKSLGPVAAVGIASAYLVQMTFLPAVLALGGRTLLWPRAPKSDPAGEQEKPTSSRLWTGISDVVSRHPRRITAGMTLLLLVGTVGLAQLNLTVNPTTGLRGNPPSVQGQKLLQNHFASLSEAPVIVVADNDRDIQQARSIATEQADSGTLSPVIDLAGHPSFSIEPKARPYSNEAFSYITGLRTKYTQAGLHGVLVGGDQAAQLDYTNITRRDNKVLIPSILIIVAFILGLLLRSLVAPLIVLFTVALSFSGSFGLSVLIFRHLFHFESIDPVLPIYVFLFVVALGVDYNIFLADRARQEAASKGANKGMLHALTVTGGVITAAGLVLAGTFAVLAVIPIVNTTVVGVAVALGVLIDSFLVRSFLLPAMTLAIGPKTWWPSKLSKPLAQGPAIAPDESKQLSGVHD